MFKEELTTYQKKRLCNCIFCGEPFGDNDSFQMIVQKRGRYSVYTFIHDDCIESARRWMKLNERGSKNGV